MIRLVVATDSRLVMEVQDADGAMLAYVELTHRRGVDDRETIATEVGYDDDLVVVEHRVKSS